MRSAKEAIKLANYSTVASSGLTFSGVRNFVTREAPANKVDLTMDVLWWDSMIQCVLCVFWLSGLGFSFSKDISSWCQFNSKGLLFPVINDAIVSHESTDTWMSRWWLGMLMLGCGLVPSTKPLDNHKPRAISLFDRRTPSQQQSSPWSSKLLFFLQQQHVLDWYLPSGVWIFPLTEPRFWHRNSEGDISLFPPTWKWQGQRKPQQQKMRRLLLQK